MLLTPDAPITVIGGKGGVGKTTVAAALSLSLADQGGRTLVMSTDPAHSLGDVLGVRLGDQAKAVTDRLSALEPDGERTAAARVRQVADDAAAVLPREILPAVRRHLEVAVDSPGAREAALIDRLTQALAELDGTWDRIVVDSAPTSHLLQLVRGPSAMADWVASLVSRRERARAADPLADAVGRTDTSNDPLLERLQARQDHMERASATLRERAVIHLVCTARRVVVAETLRAASAITDAGLQLGAVIVNDVGGQPDQTAMEQLHRRFHRVLTLPAASTEPLGPDALRGWWANAAEG